MFSLFSGINGAGSIIAAHLRTLSRIGVTIDDDEIELCLIVSMLGLILALANVDPLH
jgi:uncharacterized membrane protein